jgi:predicted permease
VHPVLATLLDPIVPVFAIMAAGFALGRARVLSVAEARTLNRVVMSVFLPILVFGLTSTAEIGAFPLIPLLIYFAAEISVLAIGFNLGRLFFRLSAQESFLLAFGAIFTNTVMYVLPISLLLYGEEAALPVASIVTLDSTLVFALAIVVTQVLTRETAHVAETLAGIVKSPIIIAIVLGLAVNLAGFTTPPPLATFIAFNGAAAPPLALFALGVVMSATGLRVDGVVATFCALNMLVFPLAVFAGLRLLASGEPGNDLFVFVAAGPAGAMAFTLALLHDVPHERIGRLILITSALTLASLAILA